MPADTHRACWIITSSPDVVNCIQRMQIPDKILTAEQAKRGTEAIFHVEYIGAPDDDHDFLTTLDALMAMGARIYWKMPKRNAPPEDN